ncbi:hypothetical protein ACLOJK_018257 [Asimina triloba]
MAIKLCSATLEWECPLDLKEAISSICFAAPRCSDLPELQQVQMLFAAKYGKEFVVAATGLMPDCGVNRQVIELLSIRAPSAEAKLKLLKEIAEEHELDWDAGATESEFTKQHEDLLNGPSQFVSGSKLPLPKEKHDGSLHLRPTQMPDDQPDSDSSVESLDLPEVPKVSLQPGPNVVPSPSTAPLHPASTDFGSDDDVTKSNCQQTPVTVAAPEMVYIHTTSAVSESNVEDGKSPQAREGISHEYSWETVTSPDSPANASSRTEEGKQFLPFIAPPSVSSLSFRERPSEPAHSVSRSKSEVNVGLQDVLAAAHAAAETAERAAAAARSAASLAEVRISELMSKRNEGISEINKSIEDELDNVPVKKTPTSDDTPKAAFDMPSPPSYDSPKSVPNLQPHLHEYQRSTSMEDDPYFSYPNLFTSPDSKLRSGIHSPADSSRSEHRSE